MTPAPSKKIKKAPGFALLLGCLGLLLVLAYHAADGFWARGGERTFRPSPAAEIHASPAPDRAGKLNLNTATLAELMGLPGIGEHLAGQIIAQREAAPFHFLEDLRFINGFGDKRIAALRQLAYVEGPAEPTGEIPSPEPQE